MRVPIFPVQGDAAWTVETIKGIVEHGWYESNGALGAPFGQLNYDFPANIGEFGKIVVVKLLALVLANPAVIANAIVVGGFPMIALTAMLVLRRLGFSRGVALVCSVLFATSPIHFLLGPVQAWLGFYVGIPFSGYLILATFGEKPLFVRRRAGSPGVISWLSATSVATLAMCLLVGCLGLDYAEFTCLLVGVGAIIVSILRGRVGHLLAAAAVIFTITIPVLASAVPDLLYRESHGTNTVVAHRYPVETLVYGLQPVQLIMPQLQDRIGLLGKFTATIDADLDKGVSGVPIDLGPQISLGLLSAVGLLWLMWVVIAGAMGHRRRETLASRAGTAALLATLLAMGSGGSVLFAYLITAQLRVWARISVLIAFFAVVGVGLLLEKGRLWLGGRRHERSLIAALLVVALGVGVVEGTSDRFIPNYGQLGVVWHDDASFVAAVQHSVPTRAMVLELPYVPYPEARLPTGLTSYEPLVPYIHSTLLRWSGGAMEGRPTDWLAAWSNRPTDELIKRVAAAGFSGVYVLRAGYADQGASVAASIQVLTKMPPLVDADGSAYFFDIRMYAAKLRASTTQAKLASLARTTLYPGARG